jgi:hypothetical protein
MAAGPNTQTPVRPGNALGAAGFTVNVHREMQRPPSSGAKVGIIAFEQIKENNRGRVFYILYKAGPANVSRGGRGIFRLGGANK